MRKIRVILVSLVLVLSIALTVSAQDYSLDPSYGEVHLSAGFLPDPHVVALTAGGSVNLDRSRTVRGIYATGYVANAPDVDFYYTGDNRTTLTIWIDGFGEDTILLINDPDGNWFWDDDSAGGVDPEVVFRRARSGLYSIWVGSYFEDEYFDAEIIITER